MSKNGVLTKLIIISILHVIYQFDSLFSLMLWHNSPNCKVELLMNDFQFGNGLF